MIISPGTGDEEYPKLKRIDLYDICPDNRKFISEMSVMSSPLHSFSIQHWDVIVIGGGATGTGIAVDAASRNFRTLLLEQADFGKGTSSRSTKLLHGGVRYMAQGDLLLVTEALRERGIIIRNAPH